MRFSRVRSGLAETSHEVIALALDSDGNELFASGDIDRPFFYRSAIKPFQSLATLRAGAELSDEQLAVSTASHGGFPVHLAIVQSILAEAGLTTASLQTPLDVPLNPRARSIQEQLGRSMPQRVFHNCSGKHAGWLAACIASGWDLETYLADDHPLQLSISEIVAESTRADPTPMGIDGCGAPAPRGSVKSLATGFRTLTTDPAFDRIVVAMERFGALVADNLRPDGRFGVNWGGPAKVGAEGVFASSRHGAAIVTKSLDGSPDVAVAAHLEVARRIGALPRGTQEWLTREARPPVLGGGLPVGSLELVEA